MAKNEKDDNDSSTIFKTLFGNAPQEGLSLFSDNPFRRKTQIGLNPDQNSHQQGSDPGRNGVLGGEIKTKRGKHDSSSEVQSPKENGEVCFAEKKKRKRYTEGSPNLDEELIQSSDAKSSIKDLEKRFREMVNLKKRKKIAVDEEPTEKIDRKNAIREKKRKRDAIEEEYEARNREEIVEKEGKEMVIGSKVGEKRKVSENAEDMVPSKEAFDDEGKLQRTVFVGNLPLKLKRKALLKEFSGFGEVESVRIRSVPLMDSKLPRKSAIFKGKFNDSIDSVHAYIVFKDEQSVQAALSHNMAKVGGNHIRVDRACPPRKKLKGDNSPLYDNKRTVFVGNLPFDVKDEELYELFCGIDTLGSSVEAVRVIRDPHTSLGKGIAYVLFKTRDAANSVVKKKHYKLRDRSLRVYHARKESMLGKRKDQAPEFNSSNKRQELAVTGKLPSDRSDKVDAKTSSLPYQGLRASKSSDRPKKQVVFRPKTGDVGRSESLKARRKEPMARTNKRPAVAARKAKANALKSGSGISRQAGKKRKPETPEYSHRKKKARYSR